MKLLHILLLLVFTTCSDSEVYIETILIKPNQSLSLIEPSFNSMNSVSFGLTPPEVYSTSNTPRIRILNIDDALNYEAALGSLTSNPTDIVTWTDINDNHQFTGLSLSNCSVYFISLRSRDSEGEYGTVQTSWALTATNSGPSNPTIDSVGTDHSLHAAPTIGITQATDACGNKYGYLAELIDNSDSSVVARTNHSGSSFKLTNIALDYGGTYYFRIKSVDLYGGLSSGVNSSTFQPSASGVFDNLSDNTYTLKEDKSYSFTPENLLPELTSTTRDEVIISSVSINNGSITESSTNNWVLLPPKNYSGNLTLSFTATLGSETTTETRTVTVTPVADIPTTSVRAFSLDSTPLTTADFSSESSGVSFDLTKSTIQTSGSQSNRWNVTSVTGSSHDDNFYFSNLSSGDSYTVTAGSGEDSIYLDQFASNLATIDNDGGTITIDTGNSTTATINYTGVSNFVFSSSVFDGNPHSIELKTPHHNWNIVGKTLSVHSQALEDEAIGILNFKGTLDSNYSLETSVNSTNGVRANGGIIFDYVDDDNFKVVVARIGIQKWSIEEMINGVKTIHVRTEVIPTMARNTAESMELRVSGQVASIYSGGTFQVSHDFGEDLNDGLIGVMTDYANTNFVLSMAPSNWAPAVEDINISMQQRDGSYTTDNLLLRAIDAENESLSFSSYTSPTGGKRRKNSDNSFTYTPWFNFTGKDKFTYTVTDGVNSATGTINIDVLSDASVTILDGESFKINLGIGLSDSDGSESATIILGIYHLARLLQMVVQQSQLQALILMFPLFNII